MNSMPVALSIAGSDNSAGAGAQADLKTFTALGVYGLTAITCVVAEVPGKVSALAPVPPDVVAEQIRLSCGAYPVRAIKTGMLHSRAIIETVCAVLESLAAQKSALVIDPVMIATSGASLLEAEGIAAYRERLFPRATLVTPNLDETSVLLGRTIPDLQAMREAGHELCGLFNTAFLVKGGHLKGEAIDLLVTPDGKVLEFSAARVPGVATHGTGCTFSAAITAGLAKGLALADAVASAKEFVTRAIAGHFRWTRPDGSETHALNHNARNDGQRGGSA